MTTTKKLSLILMMLIGGIMLNITSNNLGYSGNKIMQISGSILLISGVIIVIISNSHEKQ